MQALYDEGYRSGLRGSPLDESSAGIGQKAHATVALGGGPNPKFAILRGALRANFEFDKDAGKTIYDLLVSFMDQK